MPFGIRPIDEADEPAEEGDDLPSTWPKTQARMRAGIARMMRRRIVHSAAACGGSTWRSTGRRPCCPLNGGYGFASSEMYAFKCVL